MVRCRLIRRAQPLRHRLRDATSPTEGRPWHSAKPRLFARGSPTRGAVERSETERLDEGQPDREALAELNLSVTADAVPPPLTRGGLGIPQSFASSPEAPLPGATATTAASGGNRESLLGPRPAGCKRQRSRRWEPQPGLVERSETERLDKGQPDRIALGLRSSRNRRRCMPVHNLPYDRRLNSRAKGLRHEMTPQERKLWFGFLRNYPIKIYNQRVIEFFIVDFYCAEAKLVIELDGSQHYTEQGQLYDHERSCIIGQYGIEVLRFSNREVNRQFEAVCAQIDRTIQQRLNTAE